MAQTLAAFDNLPADPQVGFDIGWDHARHGLVPPPEQWLDGNPLHQGWRAGRACFGERTLAASRRVRLWLALRLHAWLRHRAFELAEVTPHYLGQIETVMCPITRRWLVQADASVDRVCDQAGYAAGNLAMVSAQANRAKAGLGWDEALVRAHQAESAEGGRVEPGGQEHVEELVDAIDGDGGIDRLGPPEGVLRVPRVHRGLVGEAAEPPSPGLHAGPGPDGGRWVARGAGLHGRLDAGVEPVQHVVGGGWAGAVGEACPFAGCGPELRRGPALHPPGVGQEVGDGPARARRHGSGECVGW